MLELNFLEGSQAGKTVRMNFETAWFGRQPTCEFVLDGEGISRVHFSIVKRGQDYALIDNKSTNGTFVNRVRTAAVTLKSGYIIAAGPNVIRVQEVAPEAAATGFRFVVEFMGEAASADRSAQVFEQSSILLGRKTICQVHLNELEVSPVHAELSYGPEGLMIADRSSGAGVHINGQRAIRQKLNDGDLVQIRPYELSVSLKQGMCVLRIRRMSLATSTFKTREAGAPDSMPAKDSRPSDNIAALPDWQQEKAPIYIPSSDILPNRARTWVLLGSLLLVASGTAYAWVSGKNFFVPAPLTEKHAAAAAECSACHATGFARVTDTGCAMCHADNAARPAHVALQIGCLTCHTEHKGANFDFTKSIGATCVPCHAPASVHDTQKAKMTNKDAVTVTFVARFLGDKDKGTFELKEGALRMLKVPADSPIHTIHAQKGKACESCHKSDDKSPSNQVLDAKGEPAKDDVGVPSKVRRERCLACHGFGPEATLESRCIGCHLEHPADPDKIARFVSAAKSAMSGPPPPTTDSGMGRFSGIAYMLGLLGGFPLIYGAWTVFGLRLNSAKAASSAATEALVLKPSSSAAAPIVNRAPESIKQTGRQAQLRPQIHLDLCLACGTCVHVCPFNVLEMVDEKAKAVRMDDCTGYAACAAECPPEAIVLIDQGPARTQELPTYDQSLETNVPGLYLAGEVTGKALIKVAINQGRTVVDSILRNRPQVAAPVYDVIVVGAGPAGASAALAAKEAGLRVLVLEQGSTANTVRNFPRQKFVMAEPVQIPLAGPLWMADGSKESLLQKWQEIIERTGLVVNEEEKVLEVVRQPDGYFGVKSIKSGYLGARVVIAVGRRGSPRKLGVPGEDSTKVAYSLLDAEAYQGKSICIVGGGDSGIEAANGLAREELKNKVFIIHRSADFSAAKPRNQKKIKKSMDSGAVTAFFNAGVLEIGAETVTVKGQGGSFPIPNDFVFVMVGGENPKKFLGQCGIEFSHRALV